MQKVTDAKKSLLIPEAWHSVIPDSCECGGDILISDNLKTTKCSEYLCRFKLAYRAVDLLTALGVKGMGENYCMGFFANREVHPLRHGYILVAPPSEHNSYYSSEVRTKNYEAIQEALTKPMTYAEAVKALALPGLAGNALKVFKGVDSYNEFIEKFQSVEREGRTLTDSQRLFIWMTEQLARGGEIVIQNTVDAIYNHAELLSSINNIFKIKKSAKAQITVAITGRPHLSGNTKDVYIEKLNEMCEGYVQIYRKDSASGVDFVIADDASSSSKYLYGLERGLLINSLDFKKHVEKILIEQGGTVPND